MKKIEPIEYDENGNPIFNLSADAANEDWIRAARLKKKADQGDLEAKRELEELENTQMVYWEEENNKENTR